MKTINLILAVGLFMLLGISDLGATNLNQEDLVEQMTKEIQQDIKKSFLDEDIGLFVEKGKKAKVYLTLRVCKDCCIEVLKVEGGDEELQKLVRSTINRNNVKTSEICKYRWFRVPLTLIYRK